MIALLKKEMKEVLRTYRVWAVPVLFLFVGLSAPASAKFLPEILKTQIDQLQAQGVTIKLSKLGAGAAYDAYFKNLTQIGLLAVILFSMNLISEEKARGILALIVTKPVSRTRIVLAKWLVHGGWSIFSLVIGAGGCYLYTLGLFGKASFAPFAAANLVMAVYVLLIFSLTLAASAVLRSQVAVGVVSLAGFSVFSLMSFFNRTLADYSPAALNDLAVKIAKNQAALSDALWPAIVTLALAGILLAGGIFIFKRLEL